MKDDHAISDQAMLQKRRHYEIERELASRLMAASKAERRTLYTDLYEELYRRIPNHVQLAKKETPSLRRLQVDRQMQLLERFLSLDKNFAEIGAGDCAVVFEASKFVRAAYAIEVSPTIAATVKTPENFQLLISDGCDIPCPESEFDVIYSNQLMEHLHPDDAEDQLKNIYKALSPGGVYICLTPNRLSGPHDISRFFDTVASGLHLREYTVTELARMFRAVGFQKIKFFASIRGRHFRVPLALAKTVEWLLQLVSTPIQSKVGRWKLIGNVIDVKLVGVKWNSASVK